MPKLDREGIFAMLQEFLHQRFDIPLESAKPHLRLSELGLDSMLMLDIMLEFEDRLAIKLSDMSLPRDASLGDVAALIERNLPAD